MLEPIIYVVLITKLQLNTLGSKFIYSVSSLMTFWNQLIHNKFSMGRSETHRRLRIVNLLVKEKIKKIKNCGL